MSKRKAERPNRYHTFLRRLHAGGRSNMYGAIPYLAAAFGCDRAEAFRIVCEWIDLQQSAEVAVPPAVPLVPRPRTRQVDTPIEPPSLFDAPTGDPLRVAARPLTKPKPKPVTTAKSSKRRPAAKKVSRRSAA